MLVTISMHGMKLLLNSMKKMHTKHDYNHGFQKHFRMNGHIFVQIIFWKTKSKLVIQPGNHDHIKLLDFIRDTRLITSLFAHSLPDADFTSNLVA